MASKRGTPQEIAVTLANFAELKIKEENKAFRRGLSFARTTLVGLYRNQGIGRTLFGKKKSGLRVLIKRTRVEDNGRLIKGGLDVRGVARLMEQGGQTKPHQIKPKNAPYLAFKGSRGFVFTKKPVRHPGSRIPRQPQAERALRTAEPRILQQVKDAHQSLIDRLGLSA